jgi:hypothetical protein
MIHSFLFVMCGRKAGINGGHTEGFRKIATDIDDWVGRECLRLTDMEADLDRFTVDDHCDLDAHSHGSRGVVTFTELDGHRHHEQDAPQHRQQPYLQQGYVEAHYDEMNPSPGYSSAGSHGHHKSHASCRDHRGEEWQWQRREGFGAPYGGAYER